MVIVHNLSSPVVGLKNPQGDMIATLLDYAAFLDVRVQIKEQSLEGYSLQYMNQSYPINSDGSVVGHLDAYDNVQELLAKLG